MLLGELLKDIDITESDAGFETDITGISCNSATIRRGELFIAITGYQTDGHKYIKDAAERGAACAVCQKKPDTDIAYIIVEDSRKAFALISAAWFGYPAKKVKLIGVTGTNGKTTVTYLVRHIIEKCAGSKAGLIGTIGNIIGDRELTASLTTPDCYELHSTLDKMVFEGCKYVVMEVSSHALSLRRVYGIEYETGIFTNLTPEHLDFHSSIEEYADTKAMLFPNCRSSCINIDDEYAQRMIKNSAGKVITYTASGGPADLAAADIKYYPDKTEFKLVTSNYTGYVKIHIPGMFTVYNTLAAIGTGLLLGYKTDDIVKALLTCPGVKGRAEVVPSGTDYTVLVDYAHTPDALVNIIKTAREITAGRVVTLFGCGGDRDKTKRPVMGKAAAELSDITIITSDNPRTEDPGAIMEDILAGITDREQLAEEGRLIVIENRREAICRALDILLMGDMLIIAGKGHETYQIHGREKIHFDDREVAGEHLRYLRDSRRKKAAHSGGVIV